MPRGCVVYPGLTVLILVAGCGGDDGLSREEFTSEAEAICDEFDQRVEDVAEPQDVGDVGRYVNEVKPLIEDGLNQLRELQPPEELEEQWDELVARNDESLAVLDDLQQAAANGDEARLQEISEEADRQDNETDRMAREIGLQKCGSDSDEAGEGGGGGSGEAVSGTSYSVGLPEGWREQTEEASTGAINFDLVVAGSARAGSSPT